MNIEMRTVKDDSNQTIKQEAMEIKQETEASDTFEAEPDTNIGMALKVEGPIKEEVCATQEAAALGGTQERLRNHDSYQHLEKHTQGKDKTLATCQYTKYGSKLKRYVGNRSNLKKNLEKEDRSNVYSNCGLSVNWKDTINNHIKRHTGEVVFQCSDCTYKSNSKQDFNNHMKKHTDEGLFQHPGSYIIIRRLDHTIQMRKHSDEYLFHCHHCTYRSIRKSDLMNHMKKHIGEGLFHCPYCTYKTIERRYLTDHMKKHTGKGLLHCPHCTYNSVWKSAFTNHMKKHTG